MRTHGRPWDRRRSEPCPDGKDVDRWRRLVRLAGKAARHPTGDMGPLLTAAIRARKARLPVGHQHAGSPFMALLTLARAFGPLTYVERGRAAPDLARLAQACADVLDPPAQPEPQRRHRADVDG